MVGRLSAAFASQVSPAKKTETKVRVEVDQKQSIPSPLTAVAPTQPTQGEKGKKRGRPITWTPRKVESKDGVRLKAFEQEHGMAPESSSLWERYTEMCKMNSLELDEGLDAFVGQFTGAASTLDNNMKLLKKNIFFRTKASFERYRILKGATERAHAASDTKSARMATDAECARLVTGGETVAMQSTLWMLTTTGNRPSDVWRLEPKQLVFGGVRSKGVDIQWRVRKAQTVRSQRQNTTYLYARGVGRPTPEMLKHMMTEHPFRLGCKRTQIATIINKELKRIDGDETTLSSMSFRQRMDSVLRRCVPPPSDEEFRALMNHKKSISDAHYNQAPGVTDSSDEDSDSSTD